MKKNWTMRVGAGLLALTLITSCFVGGTFAKYTTAGKGEDSARVAKFGVEVEVTNGGSAFSSEYAQKDATGMTSLAVKAESNEAVVAPGTSYAEAKANDKVMQFKISGKPEVAVNIDINFVPTNDIMLKAGTYTDWTEAPYKKTFNLVNEYHPVVFTLSLLNDVSENATVPRVLKTGTLKEISDYLNGEYKNGAVFAPGTDLGATFELSWKWAFDEDDTDSTEASVISNDAADTLLGNIMADSSKYTTGLAADSYSTNIEYECTVTVTQID